MERSSIDTTASGRSQRSKVSGPSRGCRLWSACVQMLAMSLQHSEMGLWIVGKSARLQRMRAEPTCSVHNPSTSCGTTSLWSCHMSTGERERFGEQVGQACWRTLVLSCLGGAKTDPTEAGRAFYSSVSASASRLFGKFIIVENHLCAKSAQIVIAGVEVLWRGQT